MIGYSALKVLNTIILKSIAYYVIWITLGVEYIMIMVPILPLGKLFLENIINLMYDV